MEVGAACTFHSVFVPCVRVLSSCGKVRLEGVRMKPIRPSLAKIMLNKSPAHAKAALDAGDQHNGSAATQLGSYVDWLVFGGEEPDVKLSAAVKEKAKKIAYPALEYLSSKLRGPWTGRLEQNWITDGGIAC